MKVLKINVFLVKTFMVKNKKNRKQNSLTRLHIRRLASDSVYVSFMA